MKRKFVALEAIASVIGHKHGVKVVFDENAATAATDCETIYLPVVTALGTEEHASLIYGLLDHEIAHIRYTDFDVIKKRKLTPLVASLGNLIEDVRIEREQAVIYPGCALCIKESMKAMIKLKMYRGPDSSTAVKPSMLFTNWLLHALLARWYQLPELDVMAVDYRAVANKVFGINLSDQIFNKALEVDRVKSTNDAYKLAQDLSDLLMSWMPKNPQTAKEKRTKDAIAQTVSAQGNEVAESEFGDRITQTLINQGCMGSAISTKKPRVKNFEPRYIEGAKHSERLAHELALKVAKPISLKLGAKLDMLLESKIEALAGFKRTGRKIDSRKLAGIASGHFNVYRHTEEVDGLNTAVKILMDSSYSMFFGYGPDAYGKQNHSLENSRVVGAAATAYAACEALNKFAIPFSLDIFGSGVFKYKGFTQNWVQRREKLLTPDAGGTNTYGALKSCLVEMLSREENRKQVILVTDGEPDDPKEAVALMNLMRKHKIEFAIVFIGDESNDFECELRKDGYAISRAKNQDELAAAFFDAVRNSF